MGFSVFNQCNPNEFFSISRIDKRRMKSAGLNISVKELKEKAKKTKPYGQILTGREFGLGEVRKTNIYRYKDFK